MHNKTWPENGDPGYFQNYNLTADPFPAGADNILYLTPGINFRLERIKEAIAGNNKIVVVTSSPGAGKSTLAEYLESIPESNWKVCLVQAQTGMSMDKLAYDLIRLASPDKPAEINRSIPLLHKYLELASRNNFVPVFIIDDADKLSLETLKFLLELASLRYAESLFRIVLFADESLIDRLDDPGLNNLASGTLYNLHLPSLSRTQLREYIDTRLNASGEVSEYPFDEDTLDSIFRLSAGLPAGINMASRQIMQSHTAPAPARSANGKIAAGFAITITAGVLIYLFLFQEQAVGPIETSTLAMQSPAESVTVEQPAIVEPEPEQDKSTDPVADEIARPEIVDEQPDPSGTEADTEAVTSTPPAADIPVPAIVDTTIVQNDVIDQQETGTVSDSSLIDTMTTRPEANTEPVEPLVQAQPEPVTEPVRSYRGASEDNIYNLDTVPAVITGIRGNSWFRTQARSAYTLQLISASDIGNVVSILDEVPGIQAELAGYVKYTPSGRPRYLMFYGTYTDQDAATAAVTNLPAGLQAVNPWPRSIGNIVDEIDTVVPPGQ